MAATIQTIHKPTRARGLDTSGNNNHAQIYSGRGLEFDGVLDYLDGPSFTDIGVTGDVTVSFWGKYNAGSGIGMFWGIYAALSDGMGVVIDRANNTLEIFDDSEGNDIANIYATTMNPDTWYRIVFVLDNSEFKLYMNGVLVGSGTNVETHWSGNWTPNIFLGVRSGAIIDQSYSYILDGAMSDFQVWDKVWTAADAEYDYLNPEQLALNRGGNTVTGVGTQLTESNLKLWYPMNEGHRGDESYILDASNTGLGDEMVLESDLRGHSSAPTGWSIGTLGTGDSLTWGANGARYVNASGGVVQFQYTANVVEGKTYKLVVVVSDYSGDRTLKLDNSAGFAELDGVGTHTFYINAKADQSTFINFYRGNGTTVDLTIESVSLKPVNVKHNATTAFYGDNTISATNDKTMAGSNNWDAYGTGTTESVTGGKLRVTTTTANAVQGASLAVANAGTPVVGRTYRIRANLKRVSGLDPGTITMYYGDVAGTITTVGGGGTSGQITDSEVQYETTIVAGSATGGLLIVNPATTTALVFEIDDVEIKEVGTASGWTDADQQLDIPQTALQSYNQLAYFLGEANQYAELDSTIGNGYAGNWSISFWLYEEENNDNYSWPLGVDTQRNILTENNQTHKLYFRGYDGGSGTYYLLADYVIPHGKWNHIVVAATGNTSVQAYINGQQFTANSDMDDTEFRLKRFMQGYGTDHQTKGSITEIAYHTSVLTEANVLDLYNDGKGKSALEASGSAGLTAYWRNNGLAEWKDLKGSNDANCNAAVTETMLITAGVDSSRDSQGFLMNRQRTTNCVNSINDSAASISGNYEGLVVPDNSTLDITSHYTLCGWFKFEDLDNSYNLFNKKATWHGAGYGLHWNTEYDNLYQEYAISTASDERKQLSRSFTPTVGVWYFIFCTHTDGGNDVRGYAAVTDTSFTSSSSSGALDSVGTNDLELTIGVGIGGNDDNSHIQFSGQIDDVQVYNGKALSTDELMRNFNAGKRSHK